MIITVKNLQQQTFTVNFQAEKTVLELKETIFNERGPEYVVEKQKLIYAGVILSDERTIASYNVDEKKFVVVMLKRDLGGSASKPDESGPQPAPSSSSTTTAGGGGSSSSEASVSSVKTAQSIVKDVGSSGSSDETSKSVGSDNNGRGAPLATVDSNTSIISIGSGVSATSGPSDTSQSTLSSGGDLAGVFSNTSLQVRAESSLLMGEEYNRSVESMIEMGYGREMVERAMAASFNNPERAVEYLISGIPETDDQFNAATAAAGETALLRGAADVGAAVAAAAGASAGGARAGASAGAPPASALGASSIASGGERGSAVRGGVGGDRAAVSRTVGGGGGTADSAAEMRTIEGGNARGSGGNAPEDPFEFLRNQPQFLQMRSLVYQNPDLLQAVLQQIGQTNPALLQLISENQDAFLSMLNQPMEGQADNTPQYMQRMTLGRRAQLAAAARAAAGGDGLHVRPAPDTAPGASGDGPPASRQRPGEGGDADGGSVSPNMQPSRVDRSGERRTLSDAFVRERAAAAAAVAALTAAASGVVERDVGGGEGGGGGRSTGSSSVQQSSNPPVVAAAFGGEEGGVATLRLTPQDQDAIERLKALGFPETLVLQAYFACDKDEQLAANFLISSAFDD